MMRERLNTLLSPQTRKLVYATLVACTMILTAMRIGTPEVLASWQSAILAVFDLLALLMAAVMTRSYNRTALYAAFGVLGAALSGIGVHTEFIAQGMAIISAGLQAVGLIIATAWTDVTVAEGNPISSEAITPLPTDAFND